MKIPLNTFILLLKIILKRKNAELILSFSGHVSCKASPSSSDEFTREHLQIFLMLFHQCSLTQRQTMLLELVQIISKSKENLYFPLLLDYWIFHFSHNSRRDDQTNHRQQSIHTDPRRDQQHHSTERIRFEDI